jgi:hypothetical protein
MADTTTPSADENRKRLRSRKGKKMDSFVVIPRFMINRILRTGWALQWSIQVIGFKLQFSEVVTIDLSVTFKSSDTTQIFVVFSCVLIAACGDGILTQTTSPGAGLKIDWSL